MKKLIIILTALVLIPLSVQADPKKITILGIGDSLMAGTQDVATNRYTQDHSWLSVLARQVARVIPVEYSNPELSIDGKRVDSSSFPTNISIPGLEVSDAASAHGMVYLLEGIPIDIDVFMEPIDSKIGSGISPLDALDYMLEKTKKINNERWVFVWLGSNDMLFNITTEDKITQQVLDERTTSIDEFRKKYDHILRTISKNDAEEIIVMTVPNVLKSAFFFTVSDLSNLLDVKIAPSVLSPHSLVPLISAAQIFMTKSISPITIAMLKNLEESEIIDMSEQVVIKKKIEAYNEVIRDVASKYGAIVLEANELVDKPAVDGVEINSDTRIDRRWGSGGMFSLDGLHPSNSGHAVIANGIISKLNQKLSTNIPEVNLGSIYIRDPYRDMDGDGMVAGPTWEAPRGSITEILRVFVDDKD